MMSAYYGRLVNTDAGEITDTGEMPISCVAHGSLSLPVSILLGGFFMRSVHSLAVPDMFATTNIFYQGIHRPY